MVRRFAAVVHEIADRVRSELEGSARVPAGVPGVEEQ
jgi:hypothetical protein